MAKSGAERAREHRARKGAKTRGDLEPCGTTAAAARHERERKRRREAGQVVPPLAEECQECADAVRKHQRAMAANRRARAGGAEA